MLAIIQSKILLYSKFLIHMLFLSSSFFIIFLNRLLLLLLSAYFAVKCSEILTLIPKCLQMHVSYKYTLICYVSCLVRGLIRRLLVLFLLHFVLNLFIVKIANDLNHER